MLEDARAGPLGCGCKPQRIVERMNADRARIVDGVKVAFAAKHRAHLVGRPTFDLSTKLADKTGKAGELVAVVGLGNVEPAILGFDPGQVVLADGVAHIVEAALRQRPQILGALKADATDDAVGRRGKARQDKAGAAPEAPPAMRPASTSTTDQPPRAISRAVVRPARPPPITQTSTSRSTDKGGRGGASTIVAANQLPP